MFTSDPVVDDLLDICIRLAGELWTVRERVRTLEAQLGPSARGADVRETHEAATRQGERDRFVQRIFGGIVREVRAPD